MTNTPPMIQQHDLLAGEHGDHTERGAERERPDIAHEDLCGIGVEPEKSEAGPDDRAAQHDDLADTADVRKSEVAGNGRVTGDVGEDSERPRDHHRGQDRESVEAVGEVPPRCSIRQ